MDDVDEAIQALEHVLRDLLDDDISGPGYWNQLGKLLMARYSFLQFFNDLRYATEVHQKAVDKALPDDPDLPRYLNNLSVALRQRHEYTGVRADLDNAIDYSERALSIAPDLLRAPIMNNLASALQLRSDDTGSPEDVNRAITLYDAIIELTPRTDPSFQKRFNNSSLGYMMRYNLFDSIHDLEKACQLARAAADSVRIGHPDRALCLNTLGVALQNRYERLQVKQDLEDSIAACRVAVSCASPGNLGSYSVNLGQSLLHLFTEKRSTDVVEEAIAVLTSAVDSMDPLHPHREIALHCLGSAYLDRHEVSEMWDDLNRSLELCKEAESCAMSTYLARALSLKMLANSLGRQFSLTGKMEYLDEAIIVYQSATELIPNNPRDRAEIYHSLGIASFSRFEELGALEDLQEAFHAIGNAITMTPDDHPQHLVSLMALANCLLRRFERLADPDDLDKAIILYTEAAETECSDPFQKASRLNGLGNALRVLYEKDERESDLDLAVSACRDAVRFALPGEQIYYISLTNLGNALFRLYERNADIEVLNQAVDAYQQAADCMPVYNHSRAMCLNGLGNALELRFSATDDEKDYNRAIQAFDDVLKDTAGAPRYRIYAGIKAANLLENSDIHRAATYASQAVKLLPLASPRVLKQTDQQDVLKMFAGASSYAAALVLNSTEDSLTALQLLEIGRGVINSLLLNTRSDIAALEEKHPEMALEFLQLRDQLDVPSKLMADVVKPTNITALESRRKKTVAQTFDNLLAKIQNLEGFENFLQAPSKEELSVLAQPGPIITLNVFAVRCDAFIVTQTGIRHIPLLNLDLQVVREQSEVLLATIKNDNPVIRETTNAQLRGILDWLWNDIVFPVFGFFDSARPAFGEKPRIWWIPVGLLGLFPIHAAGSEFNPDHNVLEYVVPSYAMTLKSLEYSRRGVKADLNADLKLLVVTMPETPERPGLPNVDKEAQHLQGLIDNSNLSGYFCSQPNKTEILPLIAVSQIVHFACHGEVDAEDPSASCLLLMDWESNPFTVADIVAMKVDSELAYLSACHAASTRVLELIDESRHLAGGFQLAGFRHVVGTLWHIDDERSAAVSRAVYEMIVKGDGNVKVESVARALHSAVRNLRDETTRAEGSSMKYPNEPMLWAPFVHFGA